MEDFNDPRGCERLDIYSEYWLVKGDIHCFTYKRFGEVIIVIEAVQM